ncbi:MAG TPA: hypothetical protein VFB34_00585 [Chloroflexota bacterium]|nr:hypothetical protein [Chloroflexota bacterium]
MTATTRSNMDQLLTEIEEIAGELNDGPILDGVETLREHRSSAKMQLLLVGTSGSGRSTLANSLLASFDLLPRSAVLKQPITLALSHGESPVVTLRYGDGRSMALSSGDLRQALLEPPDGVERIEILSPGDLLEICDLRIESLDASRENGEWRDILRASDYIVLVLNASALLSEKEKRFIRELLAPQLAGTRRGWERTAIVINKMDLVNEDEREEVLEYVRRFLGPFAGEPPLLALCAMHQSGVGSETNPAALAVRSLMADLMSRRVPLRGRAIREALEIMVRELERSAMTADAVAAAEEAEVRAAVEEIQAKQKWTQGRIARLQRSIDGFLQTVLRERLWRQAEQFADRLEVQLPDEVGSVEDLATVRRHLGGYVEAVWGAFLERRVEEARESIEQELERVTATIRDDLAELIGGAGPTLREALQSVAMEQDSPHVFMGPRRGKHRASNIARALSIHGLIMLYWSPLLGILSLAGGQVIQRAFKGEIGRANREALTASARAANRELEDEVKRRIGTQLSALSEHLQVAVAAAFEEAVGRITETLDERSGMGHDVVGRRRRLTEILQQRLPRVHAELSGLEAAE